MKRVVFVEDLSELEIRPDNLYNRYKDLLKDEIMSFFPDKSLFVETNCPGCGGEKPEKAFVKFGFQYCKCGRCGSLFVSPRPTAKMLGNFYQNSRAVSFWRNEMAEKTKESRNRHQLFPVGQWVLELVDEYLPEAKTFLDYHSKYPGLLSTIGEAMKFSRVISISPELPESKGLFPDDTIVYDDISSIKEKVDVFTAFEVIERIFDPAEFIKEVYQVCQSQGLFFLTTNTFSGFEYQILNAKSPRLHPPDRINLLSIEAIHSILTESGFEVIELSTPGRLDVEIVRNALESNPAIPAPEFLKYIFKNRDKGAWHSLQDFLQQNRLSSYVRVAARKK